MRHVRGKDIREIVADPEWQALREEMVGTWRRFAKANVARLAAYVGDGSDALRVARVYNYLTGTAFRTRMIQHPDIDALLARVREWHTQHGDNA
jgi:hypothetical protein